MPSETVTNGDPINTREGTPMATREGVSVFPRRSYLSGDPQPVTIMVDMPERGARSRRMTIERRLIYGLRDDVGGKCTVFTMLPAMPTIPVVGDYDELRKAVWDDSFTPTE